VRKIIHIDMDCFYAAVEMRDDPALQGKPIAVGGAADQRGVLSTCNYEARKFGLHSAMASAKAFQLCPQLILLPVNMAKYREASVVIHEIFHHYSDRIEPLSLDEAYLDVSDSTECQGSATLLAQKIRQDIYQALTLTASAGIAPNKFLAKVASDWNKPNGQFCIPPQHVDAFIKALSVKKIPGVGRVSAKKLHDHGIKTCSDLQTQSKLELHQQFGKFGERLYDCCRGIDDRPVEMSRLRKSVSVETTFIHDLGNLEECQRELFDLQERLHQRLKKYPDRPIHKQFIKIKFADFTQTTKECVVTQLENPVFSQLLCAAMEKTHKKVRLLGVGIRFSEKTATNPAQSMLL